MKSEYPFRNILYKYDEFRKSILRDISHGSNKVRPADLKPQGKNQP